MIFIHIHIILIIQVIIIIIIIIIIIVLIVISSNKYNSKYEILNNKYLQFEQELIRLPKQKEKI